MYVLWFALDVETGSVGATVAIDRSLRIELLEALLIGR